MKKETNLELTKLFTTSNEHEAHLLCQRLCNESIEARVVGQHIESDQPLASSIEIWVPQDHLKSATKLMHGWKFTGKPNEDLNPFSVLTAISFLVVAIGIVALFTIADPPVALAIVFVAAMLVSAGIRYSTWFNQIGGLASH